MKKSTEDVIHNWLEKGEHDFKAAKILLDTSEPLTDVICFHCHQATEKYLKAFLIYKKISFSKTHDLDYLHKLCIKEEMAFHSIKNEVSNLIEYASETRYPAENISYSLNDAEEAYRNTEIILPFVKNIIILSS